MVCDGPGGARRALSPEQPDTMASAADRGQDETRSLVGLFSDRFVVAEVQGRKISATAQLDIVSCTMPVAVPRM